MNAAASDITAILLAGARPVPDPLAVAAGVAVKPLVPVAGEPMINRPARALLAHTAVGRLVVLRSEEHTSELQSLMRISYAVFCLKKKKKKTVSKRRNNIKETLI